MEIGLEALIGDGLEAHVEESRAFNAELAAKTTGQPHPDMTDARELKAAREALGATATERDPAAVERLAEAESRQVPVRVITPSRGEPRAVYLNFHGGGFCLGSAARGDARGRRLAEALRVAVVNVDYRLAPEHPWPAAPDDCETAALWLLDQAESLFGTRRLIVAGPSAGATLAMTTLLRLRDRDLLAPFLAAVLPFGTYDLSDQTPAGRGLAGESFIEAYVGDVADRTDPDISPIFGDLRGLPPALLTVGTLDLVFEHSLALAARLSAAGGRVDLRVYPESQHGFTAHPTAMAAAAIRDTDAWLEDRLAERP